jgi:uncharacterized protein (TIGR03435 family)
MRRMTVALAVLAGTVAFAQSPAQNATADTAKPAFEVASVKRNPAPNGPMSMRMLPGGGFSAVGFPLSMMISQAYGGGTDRFIGGPGWLETERFDVEARPPGEVPRAQALLMLQQLLEDRFKLVLRKESRGLPVYALTMARADGRLGPGIRRSVGECVRTASPPPIAERQLRTDLPVPCGWSSAGAEHAGGGQPLRMLALTLRRFVDHEVVDRTGLTGNVDFYFTLPAAGRGNAPSVTANPDDVSVFTAVQEQLGMKLQRDREPREVYVIERAEMPTPN